MVVSLHIPVSTKTEREIDRKTERQTDRKTERQKDRKTERQKDRKTERQKDRKTERQKDRIIQNQTRSNLTLHKPKLTELYPNLTLQLINVNFNLSSKLQLCNL
jgi:hypothetical protein